MRGLIAPEKLTIEDLKEWLINVHEKYYIELKTASELPNAFWESTILLKSYSHIIIWIFLIVGEKIRGGLTVFRMMSQTIMR